MYRFVVSLPIALGGLADADSMMEGVDVEALSSCLVLPKPRKPRFLGLDPTLPVSCSGCLPIEFVWAGVEDLVEEECVSWRLLMAGACASLMVADLGGGPARYGSGTTMYNELFLRRPVLLLILPAV